MLWGSFGVDSNFLSFSKFYQNRACFLLNKKKKVTHKSIKFILRKKKSEIHCIFSKSWFQIFRARIRKLNFSKLRVCRAEFSYIIDHKRGLRVSSGEKILKNFIITIWFCQNLGSKIVDFGNYRGGSLIQKLLPEERRRGYFYFCRIWCKQRLPDRRFDPD